MKKEIKCHHRKAKKLIDSSGDSRANEYQPLRSIEERKLDEARYQAQQMFQRGGLDQEQAYAAYGLDTNGTWIKK